jgi:hypothetical protein
LASAVEAKRRIGDVQATGGGRSPQKIIGLANPAEA